MAGLGRSPKLIAAMRAVEAFANLGLAQVEVEEVAACLEPSDQCLVEPQARGHVTRAVGRGH
jgi:hypothetical protein